MPSHHSGQEQNTSHLLCAPMCGYKARSSTSRNPPRIHTMPIRFPTHMVSYDPVATPRATKLRCEQFFITS